MTDEGNHYGETGDEVAPWLTDDDFFRPSDYLAVQVIHNASLSTAQKLKAGREFANRWGEDALAHAIHEASIVDDVHWAIRSMVGR